MSTKIKPCPFCDSDDVEKILSVYSFRVIGRVSARVGCNQCKSLSAPVYIDEAEGEDISTEEIANRTGWNNRAYNPEADSPIPSNHQLVPLTTKQLLEMQIAGYVIRHVESILAPQVRQLIDDFPIELKTAEHWRSGIRQLLQHILRLEESIDRHYNLLKETNHEQKD